MELKLVGLRQVRAFGDWQGRLQLYSVLSQVGSILTLGSGNILAAVWPLLRGKL